MAVDRILSIIFDEINILEIRENSLSLNIGHNTSNLHLASLSAMLVSGSLRHVLKDHIRSEQS